MSDDQVSIERFKVMERKLYRGIMMPSFINTPI
jgi:putative membrane protein